MSAPRPTAPHPLIPESAHPPAYDERLPVATREAVNQLGLAYALVPVPTLFELHRVVDVSQISGTGRIVTGVIWPGGSTSQRWCTQRPPAGYPSTVHQVEHYPSIAQVMGVHGHAGATELVVRDATLDRTTHVDFFVDERVLPDVCGIVHRGVGRRARMGRLVARPRRRRRALARTDDVPPVAEPPRRAVPQGHHRGLGSDLRERSDDLHLVWLSSSQGRELVEAAHVEQDRGLRWAAQALALARQQTTITADVAAELLDAGASAARELYVRGEVNLPAPPPQP